MRKPRYEENKNLEASKDAGEKLQVPGNADQVHTSLPTDKDRSTQTTSKQQDTTVSAKKKP